MSDENFTAPDPRFSAFVFYQTQAGVMFLGQVENPQTGKTEQDLKKAANVIDNLEMLREKTRNNLNESEEKLLKVALDKLRETYLAVSES
ncbi:MAG: DUF1844 domain-containing protein [Akkermansiaceae bacterium]